MNQDSVFLDMNQALRAIFLDFRGYEPQPMLFCEVLRLLAKEKMIYQRQRGKEGLWIADQRHRMRWLEGKGLTEYMCRLLQAFDWTPERLAAVCRLVFQTPCRPENHPPGVHIETQMHAFACRNCGHCCRSLAYHDAITAEDVARLEREGCQDILKWVRIIQSSDGRIAYRAWVIPGSNQFAVTCPFLKQGPSHLWLCSIHRVKPQICSSYPVSRKHALMTGCPGFDKLKVKTQLSGSA